MYTFYIEIEYCKHVRIIEYIMIEYMTRLFYLFYNVKIKQVMLNSLISNIAASKLNHRVTSIQHHITQFHRWNHQWILINTTKSTLDIHWNHSISKQKYPPVACMSTSMWPMTHDPQEVVSKFRHLNHIRYWPPVRIFIFQIYKLWNQNSIKL